MAEKLHKPWRAGLDYFLTAGFFVPLCFSLFSPVIRLFLPNPWIHGCAFIAVNMLALWVGSLAGVQAIRGKYDPAKVLDVVHFSNMFMIAFIVLGVVLLALKSGPAAVLKDYWTLTVTFTLYFAFYKVLAKRALGQLYETAPIPEKQTKDYSQDPNFSQLLDKYREQSPDELQKILFTEKRGTYSERAIFAIKIVLAEKGLSISPLPEDEIPLHRDSRPRHPVARGLFLFFGLVTFIFALILCMFSFSALFNPSELPKTPPAAVGVTAVIGLGAFMLAYVFFRKVSAKRQ